MAGEYEDKNEQSADEQLAAGIDELLNAGTGGDDDANDETSQEASADQSEASEADDDQSAADEVDGDGDAAGDDDQSDDADAGRGEGDGDGDADDDSDDSGAKKEDDDADAGKGKGSDDDAAEQLDKEDAALLKGLSDTAQKRFRGLVSTIKDKDEQLTQTQSVVDSFQNAVTFSRLDKDELVKMFTFARHMKSTDPQELRQAKTLMEDRLNKINLALGESSEIADPLLSDPDLYAKVESNELDREVALQLLGTKRKADLAQTALDNQNQANADQAAVQAAQTKAITDMNVAESYWLKNDSTYKTDIQPELMEYMKGEFAKGLSPDKYAQTLMDGYAFIKRIKSSVTKPAPKIPVTPRSTGSGGGAPAKPKTMEDVTDYALAEYARTGGA